MNPERWKRIEEAFHNVAASPPSRRAAALEEACSDDQEMRREIESLMNAREQAGSFLMPADLEGSLIALASEPEMVGSALGHYQVLSFVGAGAMGEVYLARDTRLDRRVALKTLPARFTRDSERVARFRREAKAASALNHPNIITIHEIGEISDTLFIAAEFIEGVTLRERLAAGPIEFKEILEITIQCAVAFEAAHLAGIIHRDIKPENIMVRPDGLVKVVDFGLARVMKDVRELPTEATHLGALIGTPRYMSPEQAHGRELDARTDIFSLGAVLYETATGQPAFPGTTIAEVFAALLERSPIAPSECVADFPAALDSIVSKALEKDPAARYQEMREFRADLERLGQQAPAAARIAKEVPGVKRWFRRVLIVALALVVAVALAWYGRMIWPTHFLEKPPLSVVPLTSFAGYKDFPSFSPDGEHIAFSWNGGEGGSGGKPERNIYTKALGSDDPIRLTSATEDDRLPVWSPDGRQIAFCRALTPGPTPVKYGIYVMSAAGGRLRKVSEGRLGASWSPDGETLAMAGLSAESNGIVLLSLASGQRRVLTNPMPYSDTLPVFSHDGRQIVFTRDFGFSAREIFVVPAHGGIPKQLIFDRKPTYGATWTGNGREIVFASNRGTGGESLWRIPATGGTPQRLSSTLEGAFYPAISPQGDRLAYTESFKDTNIYAYDGAGFGGRSTPARFAGPKRRILSSRRDDSPSISPDGGQIAFVSTRTGNEEIWVCGRNGSHPVRLTYFNGPGAGTPRWSPDGQWIAFDSLAAGNPNIYVIEARGGGLNRLTTGSSGNFMPSWSPDSKWVYFKSDRSGGDEIWRAPATGGAPVQVTQGGASEGFASPDGKLLYFTRHSWGPIWTVPVNGGVEALLKGMQDFNKIFRSWGVVKEGIYFLSREDGPRQTVRFFSFATGKVTPLMLLDKDPIWDYPDLALSLDGHQLLAAFLDQEVNDLMQIENFR